MFLRTKAPATLATTALMLLRNQLSERVWGTHGINTLAIDGPRPTLAGAGRGGVAAHHLDLRRRREKGLPQEPHHIRPHPVARPEGLSGIGSIGDSLSDEYRFYAPDRVTARNWVEILAATRDLPFGDPLNTPRGAVQ